MNNFFFGKDVLLNIFYLFLNKGINALVPLILIPLIIEKYSVTNYGKLVYFQNIALFFMLLADYGFVVTGTRDIRLSISDVDHRNRITSSIFFVKILLCISSLLLFLIIFYVVELNWQDFLLAYSVLFTMLFQSMIPVWYFQGIEKNQYLSVANFVSKIFLILLSIFFITRGYGLLYYQITELISYLITVVISFFIMIKYCDYYLCKPEIKLIKNQFISGFNIFGVSILNWCLTAGVIFIVKKYTESIEFGYYATFSRLVYYIFIIIFPIIQALFPYFVNHFNSAGGTNNFNFRKIIRFFIFTVFLLVFASLFGAKIFFTSFFSIEFNRELVNYIYVFYFLVIWIGLVLYNNFIGIQFFVSKGLDKQYRIFYSINTFIVLVSSFILVPMYYSFGAAISLILGELVLFIIYLKKLNLFDNLLLSKEK